jgi:zinc transport system substrate-binding protein
VVTTIFPQYDFTRQIVGDKADVTMLLAPGAESHSYEPTPQDIIKIQNSDVFIYVGGENDAWVDSILESVDQSDMKVIKLLNRVDPLGEEVKEGMEPEEEEDAAPGEENDGIEYDEHIWTSPQNAVIITNVIRDALCELDSGNAAVYQSNAEKYVEQLNSLDADFKKVVESADRRSLVFGDRFPLRYFTEYYGLDYWAAFPGCSGETEPSAATIAFLADKVEAEKIPVIFKIELSNGNVAQSIAEATGAKVLTFYSCHNLAKSEFESGATYLSMMRKNVEALREALN